MEGEFRMKRNKIKILKICAAAALGALLMFSAAEIPAQRTEKPVLHAKHWIAITGKPLGATAGAKIFDRGGNAVDAACSMLAAVSTMWDVLGWGGVITAKSSV
jgi:gamma-glutamyltranspeptidase/glutathione hydrolase